MAGLRLSGIAAPFVLDEPINRHTFEAYIARVLIPELTPGDVVIMDNLSTHKGPRCARDQKGWRQSALPPTLLARTEGPCSDFNPTEKAFAKLKALLRKAAERTVDGLWSTIGSLIDTVTPDECANFFAAAAGCDAT